MQEEEDDEDDEESKRYLDPYKPQKSVVQKH